MKKNVLHIGLDLDNTLISYDHAFVKVAQALRLIPEGQNLKNKQEVRTFVRKKLGESEWQRLQGQVYGKFIKSAEIFHGVYRFLWRCRLRNIKVQIVSHKTEFGHFDPEKIPLREAAISFLDQAGIGIESGLVQEINFADTRKEKVKIIAKKTFSHFVDDLPEVFSEHLFPEGVKQILFSLLPSEGSNDLKHLASWTEIEREILGDWQQNEILNAAQKCCPTRTPVKSSLLSGQGNSQIHKITWSDDKGESVLKLYPDSDIDRIRLKTETCVLQWVHQKKMTLVPQVQGTCESFNFAVYEWIDGESPSPSKIHLGDLTDFLQVLHQERFKQSTPDFGRASAACLSGEEALWQLEKRLQAFLLESKDSEDLHFFLSHHFIPVKQEVVKWYRANWPEEIPFDAVLPKEFQTLSPSDFGFHNTLLNKDGQLYVIDLEYFGWDDPAKLIADVFWHPGANLTEELRQEWIEKVLKLYASGDQFLVTRFRLLLPLLGLCWCLIILNEFRTEVWNRRCQADPLRRANKKQILDKQLFRAQNLLTQIQKNYYLNGAIC